MPTSGAAHAGRSLRSMDKNENWNGLELYIHYFGLALAVAGTLFLTFCFAEPVFVSLPRFAPILATLAYILIGLTLFHTALWSVFGVGGFVLRSAVAISVSGIVAAGIFLGSTILMRHQFDNLFYLSQLAFLYYLPCLMAAQLPLWILRSVFGWQFVLKDSPPVALSIKQLFLVTFVFAIAFTMPAAASRVVENSYRIEIGHSEHRPETLPDGTVVMKQVEITPDNVQKIRDRNRRESRSATNQGMTIAAINFSILSLLCLPLVWMVFRARPSRVILYSMVYGLLLFIAIAIGYSVIVGVRDFIQDAAVVVVETIVLSICLLVWPLAVSRSKGFELSTNRTAALYRKRD